MLRHTIGTVALLCVSAGLVAAAPAVDSMTCSEMTAELVAAGQKMASQMDPEFAKEAQAMMDEAQAKGAGAADIGMGAMCAIPGLGMMCMMGQMANAGGVSEERMQRMQAQMERLEKAMEGLDVERLTVLSQRFDEMKCEVPK